MIEATFVLYVRKPQLGRLRELLMTLATDPVRWQERRRLFGSEFYVRGPSSQAREAHQAAVRHLTTFDGPR